MLICWVISIQWELIEILFQHMLPNFAECWWDQWVLDVLLSNALGIYLGCKLAKYLEMKEYRWGSDKQRHCSRCETRNAQCTLLCFLFSTFFPLFLFFSLSSKHPKSG